MTAVSVSVADAVVAMLTTATDPVLADIAPVRSYADWDLALEDASTLHVDVVAVTTDQRTELAARGHKIVYQIPIDIAVRFRFGASDQSSTTGDLNLQDVDNLVETVEQIHELFMPNRLADFSAGVWQETKIIVCPLLKHLRELRQFTAIVRVTFRVDKALPFLP